MTDESGMAFTGKERDGETGLGYFGARYMNSAQGRFTSPDLVNVTNDRLLNPSNTLNKYVYGGNNPLKYTDPDGRDITIFYETGFPTGHVMMAATNQETNDFAFMSVGPQTHHDPNILSNPIEGVPGTSEFNLPRSVDELRNNFAALTIQTTPEVAQQAIDAIRAGAGTGNWAMLGNNCTSACATVLKDLGLSPGSKGFLPWTPSRFWANLYFKYGKSKQPAWLRWTVQATSLIQRPVTTGYDYGNSRYGMNTFDFIMLQLNAPQKACVTTPGLNGGPPEKVCQ